MGFFFRRFNVGLKIANLIILSFFFCLHLASAEEADGDPWDFLQCARDLSGDGRINFADLEILLASWGVSPDGDIDGSGSTGMPDLNELLQHWNQIVPECEISIPPRYRIKREEHIPEDSILSMVGRDGAIVNREHSGGLPNGRIVIRHPFRDFLPDSQQSESARTEVIVDWSPANLKATAYHPSGIIAGYRETIHYSGVLVREPIAYRLLPDSWPVEHERLVFDPAGESCFSQFQYHGFVPQYEPIRFSSAAGEEGASSENIQLVSQVHFVQAEEWSPGAPYNCPLDWEVRWLLRDDHSFFESVYVTPLPEVIPFGISPTAIEVTLSTEEVWGPGSEMEKVLDIGHRSYSGGYSDGLLDHEAQLRTQDLAQIVGYPLLDFEAHSITGDDRILLELGLDVFSNDIPLFSPAYLQVVPQEPFSFDFSIQILRLPPHLRYLEIAAAVSHRILASNDRGDIISGVNSAGDGSRFVTLLYRNGKAYELRKLVSDPYPLSGEELDELFQSGAFEELSFDGDVLIRSSTTPPVIPPGVQENYSRVRLAVTCPSDMDGNGVCDEFDQELFNSLYSWPSWNQALLDRVDFSHDGIVNFRDRLVFEMAQQLSE
ncbi:MAG: hypothetical protein KDD64_16285 [Bdellovibrionales bacterium]|nr:hypothetical protein [Bdellovibrionales bacterium]